MTVYGVDLSHWNTLPNLSSYSFVFQKATQGVDIVDPTYTQRHNVVRDAGKVFGGYHFMTAASPGKAQAEFFARIAGLQAGDVAAVDFEDDGSWPADFGDPRFAAIAATATECMDTILAALPANRVLLYCNSSTYENIVVPHKIPVGDGLWDAAYRLLPPPDPWLFWQNTSSPVDLDQAAAFADLPALARWVAKTPTVKGMPMSSFGDCVVDMERGRAYVVFEVGSNSQLIHHFWLSVKALWGDVGNVRVTFVDDHGNAIPEPATAAPANFAANQRVWWQLPDGASQATLEWDPAAVSERAVLALYSVWD
jgi:hypothetical protein